MTTTGQPAAPAEGARETFDSLEPASGAVVATFPIMGADDVRAAVERARPAAAWWASLGFDGRRRRLRAFKARMARRSGEITSLIQRENGKPRIDALTEVVLAIDHIEWASRHAGSVLKPRRVRSGLLAINHASWVEYEPLGVVGVIGPWNYPLFTPMGSIAYALAAGNAVVFKPSEYTPAIGAWLADTFAEVVPEHPVFQVVTGLGATGSALCQAGVDKLAFTGSAATGRRVMAACADHLTPVLLELGGKDAMIVDDDADVEAAADAAVFGGISNAGQTCIGVERVYATERVYDRLVQAIAEKARTVRAGADDAALIGPITMPGQRDIIQRHVTDALRRGARAVVGGEDAVDGVYAHPVVLTDVPDDAPVMREETFGPVIPVVKVRDAEEAVHRANATPYGLASSVYGKRRAVEIARRLRAGMTSINSVLTYATVPGLPFGGVGESGFGRIHGEEGLREFVRPHAFTRERFPSLVRVTSFERSPALADRFERITRWRHGRS